MRVAILGLVLPALLAGLAVGIAWWLVPSSPSSREGTANVSRVTPPIPPHATGADGDWFTDVTAEAGIDFVHDPGDDRMDSVIESVGCGATWFDHDGDGFLDLYLVNQRWLEGVSTPPRREDVHPNRLYRNRGDGTFEDVTERAGVGDTGYGFSAAAADYDGDGHVDLHVSNSGENRLYRNRGDGTFEDVTRRAGVQCPGCSVSSTFLDADGDGRLDLYVGNYLTYDASYQLHYAPDVYAPPLAFAAEADVLYINQGDGTFAPADPQPAAGVAPGRAMGVLACDLDSDGRTDIFVANDASANFLLRNLGGGRFEESGALMGVAFGFNGEATGAMAAALGDIDGDGRPDLHVTDITYGSLYRSSGEGWFEDVIIASGVAAVSGQWTSWGGGFLDFDSDGDLDLYIGNGDLHRSTGRPDLLLVNPGDGRFLDGSAGAGAYFEAALPSRGGCIGDYDNDGDLDVLVTTLGDRPVLLRNRGAPGRHRITLDLRGAGGRADALGAVVRLEAGGSTWVRTAYAPATYLCQGDPRLHFGLGRADSITRIEITWPGGATTTLEEVAVDQILKVVEKAGAQ